MKKVFNTILIVIINLVIIFSCIYILLGSIIEQKIIESYKPKIEKTELRPPSTNINYDWSQVSNTNLLSVAKSRLTNRNQIIGMMTQPEAKVAVTIVEGVDQEALNLSAGTIRPGQKMGEGNYVLVAHHVPKSEWALFSGVYYHSEIGQKIYLTDLKKVYEYTITNVKFVPDTAVYITDQNKYKSDENGHTPGKPLITIISCDATGDARITEYGTLTNTYDFDKNNIPKEAVSGFEKAADFNWK